MHFLSDQAIFQSKSADEKRHRQQSSHFLDRQNRDRHDFLQVGLLNAIVPWGILGFVSKQIRWLSNGNPTYLPVGWIA
jgi:hypothetical protein